jgi:hypothetical protein
MLATSTVLHTGCGGGRHRLARWPPSPPTLGERQSEELVSITAVGEGSSTADLGNSRAGESSPESQYGVNG